MTAECPYSVMAQPDGAYVAFEPLLLPAAMEREGWVPDGTFIDYRTAMRHHAVLTDDSVQRWWVASWPARAKEYA